MNQALFRPEVITERQTQWLGTVLLKPRMPYRLFTLFAVLTTGLVLTLLFLASYPRKARINGWLVPEQGLIRVFTPQAGVITHLYGQEGMEVRQGDRLLVLSTDLHSAALGDTQREVARQLLARRRSLLEEQRQHERLLVQQKRALTNRLQALQKEYAQLDREVALQNARFQLAEKAERRQHDLRQRGFVSDMHVQQAEESRIEQDLKLRTLERTRMVAGRERLALESELQDLPFKFDTQIAAIKRNIAELEQQLAETEARREIVVTAPQAGTVTAVQAERGGRVSPTTLLLSIVPAGTKLEAHLFSPSRSVGFVKAGQRVLLRYQAYPYQKFGHYEGIVANISRSAVSPQELPSQLAGLTSLYSTNEPIYRITVQLGTQAITAYGQPVSLQPGMQLEADVVTEHRRLIEWVLDPLYTLTGKWNG